MQIGIVGAQGSGVTTIFNAASAGRAPVGSYRGGGSEGAHQAVIKVPDERVVQFVTMFQPKSTVFATVEYVDIPHPHEDVGLSKGYLNSFRTMDALAVVLRAFPEVGAETFADRMAQAERDLAELFDEMVLADLVVVEKRIESATKQLRARKDDVLQAELDLIISLKAELEASKPIRARTISVEEERLIRGYRFLSQKPVVVCVNIGEDAIGQQAALEADWRRRVHELAGGTGLSAIVMCGQVESELAQMEPEDAAAFMTEYGIERPALPRFIAAAYELCALISFFTVGEDEVRAWTIPAGTTALKAAGTIHSDIERGFIRAEVCAGARLLEAGSMKALKDTGELRLEGKEYVVRDGDVCHFRFNVG